MTRSMQRHLSVTASLAILLAGLIAAAASFSLAYKEAKEFQDDMLRQIAALASRGGSGSTGAANANKISDPESQVWVIHLPTDARPDWLPANLAPGFHTVNVDAAQLRLYIRDWPGGTRTVVAQATDARDEIALNSAWRTLLPLLLLLPLLIWLINRIVRRELAPIASLSKTLDEQPAHRPQAIDDVALPSEILPFVHAINRLLERVNILMSQQRHFIADAAHELRSPLTALSVQAQNIAHADSLNAALERVLPLQEGIARAQQLTAQLLNLARIQAGAREESVVDVSVLARELIAEYLPRAAIKGIDLGLEESAPLSVRASAESLGLILRNGLDNALKYAPDRGVVTLRLFTDRGDAVIEVEDNGAGIPPEEIQRVFDPFYRIAGAAGEGSGLGLAIAREAAQTEGGVVSLHERKQGGGLIFRYRQSGAI